MGRLQKSKKHRKIKAVDPFYSGKRKTSEKTHENSAPKNDDHQEIPRKVKFYMDNKDKFKSKRQRTKKRNQTLDASQVMLPGQTRPMDPAPRFIQRKNEKQKDFLNRVENDTHRVLLQAKLSDKYGISIDDVERGNLQKKKKMSNSRKEKLKHKKDKMRQKKQDREVDNKEADFFKDEVKFGEVVSAPPTLTAKPRKAVKNEQFAKPGRKSLLLKEIITGNSQQSPMTSLQSTREIGQSTKRKHLSMAKQQMMDAERQKAIDLYRMLKNKKVKES